MSGRGSEISSNTVLERHESPAHPENGTLNALELLAQAPKNLQSNEQLTQNYVDKNALPTLTIDDKSYLPGYTYTKTEADAHRKEILQSGNMSSTDMDFLRTMYKQEEREHDKQLSDVINQAGVKSPNIDKVDQAPPKQEPTQDNVKEKKFELSAEAEKVAWDAWLAHLNDQIAKTLNKLVAEGKIPDGATGTASYVVAADGRFALSYEARPAAYARVIGAALNDAFKNHKELLKFPEGAHKNQFKRTTKFTVGAETSVTNGPTEDEYVKK